MARGHRGLGDAPSQTEGGHEDAVGDLDDEDGRKWLPRELGNGRDRSHQRVLVAGEVAILLEAEEGAVSQNRLVEDLKEVNPDEND